MAMLINARRFVKPPGNPALWWRADDLTGGEGAAVATWAGHNGIGRALTAAGGQEPIKKLNVLNGQPVVGFNGKRMTTSGGSLISQPITIIGVARLTDITDTDVNRTLIDGAGSACRLMHFFVGGGTGLVRITSTAALTGTFPATLDIFKLYMAVYSGVSSEIYINNALNTSGDAGTTGYTEIRLGGSSTDAWIGDVAEILVYHGTLTTAQRTALVAYVNTLYGLGI